MNWLAYILAFVIALVVGSFLGRLLARSRPHWGSTRRLWAAALVLPMFIVLLTAVGLAWVVLAGPGEGENMLDLALVVTAMAGAFFAVIALIGGLVGASLAERRP